MPRYVSTTRAFVNGNIIDQVPGKGAPGSSGATGPPGSGAALYVQAADPGAVGPNSFWAKTGGVENALYVRDPTNSAWLLIFSPPQWTVGANGDVTATVDDPTKTPITIEALAGQVASLLLMRDEFGSAALDVDASGKLTTSYISVRPIPVDVAAPGPQWNMLPDQLSLTSSASVNPIIINAPDGNTEYLYLRRVGGGSSLEINQVDPADVPLWLIANAAPTVDLFRIVDSTEGLRLFGVDKTGIPISNAQSLPDVADLQVGDHGSISDPTAASPTITRFLKDSASVLRTEKVSLGVPDYTQSFLLAGV